MAGSDGDRADAAVGVCACGGGRRAPIAKRSISTLGHVKGQPVCFVRGHATRGRKRALVRLHGVEDGHQPAG